MAIEESGAPIAVAYVEVRADMTKYDAAVKSAAGRTVPVYDTRPADRTRRSRFWPRERRIDKIADQYETALGDHMREMNRAMKLARTRVMTSAERLVNGMQASIPPPSVIRAWQRAAPWVRPQVLLGTGTRVPISRGLPAVGYSTWSAEDLADDRAANARRMAQRARSRYARSDALNAAAAEAQIRSVGTAAGQRLQGMGLTGGVLIRPGEAPQYLGATAAGQARIARLSAGGARQAVATGMTGGVWQRTGGAMMLGPTAAGTQYMAPAVAAGQVAQGASKAGMIASAWAGVRGVTMGAVTKGVGALTALGQLGKGWDATAWRHLLALVSRTARVTSVSRVLELTGGVGRFLGTPGVALAAGILAAVHAASEYTKTMTRANEMARQLAGKRTILDLLEEETQRRRKAQSYVIAGPGTVFWSERKKMLASPSPSWYSESAKQAARRNMLYAEEGWALLGEYAVKFGREVKAFFGWLAGVGVYFAAFADAAAEADKRLAKIDRLAKAQEEKEKRIAFSMSASAFGWMDAAAKAQEIAQIASPAISPAKPIHYWRDPKTGLWGPIQIATPHGGEVTMSEAAGRYKATRAERYRGLAGIGLSALVQSNLVKQSTADLAQGGYDVLAAQTLGAKRGWRELLMTPGLSENNDRQIIEHLNQLHTEIADTKQAVFSLDVLN